MSRLSACPGMERVEVDTSWQGRDSYVSIMGDPGAWFPVAQEREGRAKRMKILLALSKNEVRDIVRFGIESRFQTRILEARSAKEAIQLLADTPDIDIVICELSGIGDVLLRHMGSLGRRRKDGSRIRCILCSAERPAQVPTLKEVEVLGHAPWTSLLDTILALLEKAQKTGAVPSTGADEPLTSLSDSEFCRIRTALLIRVGPLKSDIYIRLSATKFLKLFNEGDRFDEKDYQRYLLEKKLEYLYLKRDECSEFLSKFRLDLLQLLQSEILCAQASPDVLEAVHETAQELLSKLGATPDVQQVVKANIQVTIKAMGKSPMLSQVLSRLKIDREKYISSHSVLLPQIAGTLAMAMDWRSEGTIYKLSLAAFLHDMPLTNHGLAAIQNMTEFARRKDQFTEQEAREYRLHPVRAAEMARQFQEVPPDVDIIIAEHHEFPDGSGFPRGLTHKQISPLASVFVVAHELVSAIYSTDRPFIMAEHLESVRQKYSSGNFKKLLHCLTDVKCP